MQVKLDKCEKIIDVLNIVLIRQKIEMEVIQVFSFFIKVKVILEYLSKSVIFNCILMMPYSQFDPGKENLWYHSNFAVELIFETQYDCLVSTGHCEDLFIKPLVSVE